MSQPDHHADHADPQEQLQGEREAIAETEDELDAQADDDGLGAEVGRSEETGIAEG